MADLQPGPHFHPAVRVRGGGGVAQRGQDFGGAEYSPNNYGWDFSVRGGLDVGSVGYPATSKKLVLDKFKTLWTLDHRRQRPVEPARLLHVRGDPGVPRHGRGLRLFGIGVPGWVVGEVRSPRPGDEGYRCRYREGDLGCCVSRTHRGSWRALNRASSTATASRSRPRTVSGPSWTPLTARHGPPVPARCSGANTSASSTNTVMWLVFSIR